MLGGIMTKANKMTKKMSKLSFKLYLVASLEVVSPSVIMLLSLCCFLFALLLLLFA